jgi:transposase
MRRYALRDDQWDRIKDPLPGREGRVGVTATDNRRFVEAVLYRYLASSPWRDLPERFGDPIKVHTRFPVGPSLVSAACTARISAIGTASVSARCDGRRFTHA